MTRAQLQALIVDVRQHFPDVEIDVNPRRQTAHGRPHYSIECSVRITDTLLVDPNSDGEDARHSLAIFLTILSQSTSREARRLFAADQVISQLTALRELHSTAARQPGAVTTAPTLWERLDGDI